MHRALVTSLKSGAVLGSTAHTDRGEVLLARGTALTTRYIQALRERGYQAVFVMDGIADDVEPRGIIGDQLRALGTASLRSIYSVDPQRPAEREITRVRTLAETILDEILDHEPLARTPSLRGPDCALFEHAIDVTLYAVMLGKRIGLGRPLLRDIALGCLLHDIGMPAGDVSQHPQVGFEIVRRMGLPNPRPAHIALQHHERQDGAGYPSGLSGTNQVQRTDPERFNPRRISLLAEIAAVADVYSLESPERAFDVLAHEAGPRLNVELVRAFVGYVQRFAIGERVRVIGGSHDGALGLVYDVSANAPGRPKVRVLFDPRGQALGDGVEIDMRDEPETASLRPIGARAPAPQTVR